VKYAWIEGHRDQFTVARMCRQLEVSRTGYCQWRKREPSERSIAKRRWMQRWQRSTRAVSAVMAGHGSCVICAIAGFKSAMNEFERV